MAKTQEDLDKSREIRKQIITKYGEVPTTIWNPNYGWGKHVHQLRSRGQNQVAQEKHKKMKYDRKLSKAFKMSSINVRGKSAGVSTFPPDVAKRIVLFYSEKNDTVLDPCAGHNSRMQITYELERNYIGYDVSKEFMKFNRKVLNEITGKGSQKLLFQPKTSITLREQTSEKLVEDNDSIDMIYTSPPYWDLEYYGDEPEQLGYKHTYEEFLNKLQTIINECYRVIKKGKYCIFNINDFRKNSIYYTYHADVISLFRKAGFIIHDVVIIKWANALGACFASQVESRKVCAKIHEYLIIGKKT